MNNFLKNCLICLGCVVIVSLVLFFINKNNKLIKINNPLTEVESVEEMKQYLGFDVPVIKDKKIINYIVIGEEDYATHARIIYEDDSSFEMEKGTNKDVSGMYGGVLNKKENINNYEVSIYTMENIIYATWSDKEYSYSYSIENGNVDDIIKNIKLIK